MLSQRCQQGCESGAKVRLSCPMGHHHRVAVAAAALVVALALSALHACCTASASAAPGSLACNTAISSASPAGASLQDHFGSSSVPTARPHDMRKEPTVTGRQRLTLDAHDPASTCSTSCPCHPLKEGNVAINASSSLRFEEVRDNQRLVRAYLLACGFSSIPRLLALASPTPSHPANPPATATPPTSTPPPSPFNPLSRSSSSLILLSSHPHHRTVVVSLARKQSLCARARADTTAYHARDTPRSLCVAGAPQLGVARLPLSMTWST